MPEDRIAFGVDQKDADAARSELIRWVKAFEPHYLHESFDKPFMSIPLEMKGIVARYLEVRVQQSPERTIIQHLKFDCSMENKSPLADILRIPKESVDRDCLLKTSTIIYVNAKKESYTMSLTEVKALIIVALGGLSYDNDLPAVESPPVAPRLFELSK